MSGIKPTTPLVALTLGLCALLIQDACCNGPWVQSGLVAVGLLAVAFSLVSSITLFREQLAISAFCILLSLSVLLPLCSHPLVLNAVKRNV